MVGPIPKQQATWLITPPSPIQHPTQEQLGRTSPGPGAVILPCPQPGSFAQMLHPISLARTQPGLAAAVPLTLPYPPPASDLPRSPIAPSCRHLQPPWRISNAPAGDQQAEHAPLLFPTQGALGGGCEGRGACTHAQHGSSCTQATFFFKTLFVAGNRKPGRTQAMPQNTCPTHPQASRATTPIGPGIYDVGSSFGRLHSSPSASFGQSTRTQVGGWHATAGAFAA